ncbi:MAG: hypothetical protein WAK91_17100 [Candidatus Acidiferrales bacterium]
MACILTVGICILVFESPTLANDNAVPARETPSPTLFGAGAAPHLMAEQPMPAPRWTLLPKDFARGMSPALSTFAAVASSPVEPTALAVIPVLRPAPASPFAAAAMPQSSSGSGHRGLWLALGISGIVVAAVGVAAYVGEQHALCSGPNPGSGCNEVKTAGLVLMPVGAAMAVVGFVMHARH